MVANKKVKKALQKAPLSMKKGSEQAGSRNKQALTKSEQVKELVDSTAKAGNLRVGRAKYRKRDLTRFVRWPQYIKVQRSERVLMKRLKVPPAVNQFSLTLDKQAAGALFNLLQKYRPENKQEKAARLMEAAKAVTDKAEQKKALASGQFKKPVALHYGLNEVTTLIEKKRATLVVIAHDVKPLEMVMWMPALCRKMNVPYCIVKGKSKLGQLVHQKNATCVCLTSVRPEDSSAFEKVKSVVVNNFNSRSDELRKTWGGGIMSNRSIQKVKKLEALKAKELKIVLN